MTTRRRRCAHSSAYRFANDDYELLASAERQTVSERFKWTRLQ